MKPTHRFKRDPGRLLYVPDVQPDRYGWIPVHDPRRGWDTEKAEWLEPIPAPPQMVPFDFESWRELLKKHDGNVWLRTKSGTVEPSACFDERTIFCSGWEAAANYYQYSTDFGETWQRCERQVAP